MKINQDLLPSKYGESKKNLLSWIQTKKHAYKFNNY